MVLELQVRPFRFVLTRPLQTAAGVIEERAGWLLRLQAADGRLGWGEVAPLEGVERSACAQALQRIGSTPSLEGLEQRLPAWPPALAFGVGAALAELAGLVGASCDEGWLPAPPSAVLLPSGARMLDRLAELLAQAEDASPLTLKWKVAVEQDAQERSWLEQLLDRLPPTAQLRLDANGGWDRSTATAWMTRLRDDPRFAWLEQPLAVEDHGGLEALACLGPVALDESLTQQPSLGQHWQGWQVRRPSQQGDPRPCLRALRAGQPRWMISTAFETGIARRWLHHLAALQWAGPTPAAPGLAPGWCAEGPLLSSDPVEVWEAAAP